MGRLYCAFIYGLTTVLVIGVSMFLVSKSFGVEVRKVTYETAKIYNYRHTYMPDYTLLQEAPVDGQDQSEVWDYHVGLGLNLNLITTEEGTFYWDQKIEGEATTKQFRRTAWIFEFGIDFGPASIYRSHMSEHLLDAISDNKYPVRDFYGFRMCFYGADCGRN